MSSCYLYLRLLLDHPSSMWLVLYNTPSSSKSAMLQIGNSHIPMLGESDCFITYVTGDPLRVWWWTLYQQKLDTLCHHAAQAVKTAPSYRAYVHSFWYICRCVKDRQTDRNAVANTACSIAARCKIVYNIGLLHCSVINLVRFVHNNRNA